MYQRNFRKPPEGSWTEHFKLGTEAVAYEDSVSEEFFELEREAIFRRVWLNVGRVEQVPKAGSYYTKDIAVCNTSLLVVRDADNKIQAFHNMCSHRGNKLVWNDHPRLEAAGNCRQFTCKYHGWRYGLDGTLKDIRHESEFFNLDKSKFGLTPVHTDVWEGFIFVNFAAQPRESLREYLGQIRAAMEGYPFDKMTEVHAFRTLINANWKIYVDSFQEIYHAPFLHTAAFKPSGMSRAEYEKILTEASFRLYGPHRLMSYGGGQLPPPMKWEPGNPNSLQNLLRADVVGAVDVPFAEMTRQPPNSNPDRQPCWVGDACGIFPNFVIEPQGIRNWYFTYHFWPLTVGTHLFETHLYFVPPRNAGDRLAQEMVVASFKDIAMQDANTLEATHSMIASRAKTHFPLSDQEVMLRHFHKVVAEYVEQWRSELAPSHSEGD